MRYTALLILCLLQPTLISARMIRDTVITRENDRVILTYDVTESDDNIQLRFYNKPRIIPGDITNKACKGNLELLKVVFFDRVGDFGNTKWNGIAPRAFTVPSGISYDWSHDGYYILGETTFPLSFIKTATGPIEVNLPLYLAVYQKKHAYKLIGASTKPLKISIGSKPGKTVSKSVRAGTQTEHIEVRSSVEIEADNDETTKALSSIRMVSQLLEMENDVPFSQTLQMEIYNLSSLKERLKDPIILEKINEVLFKCNEKEQMLKESRKEAALASETQEQELMVRQKAEETARQKEAEEKAELKEAQQQKRTLWMIIGGVILGVLGFIGNGIFRHFRDLRNQKSIMQMQDSLARQASHEATRRSREIVRNKAHQMTNKGKSMVRKSLNERNKSKKNSDIKSI